MSHIATIIIFIIFIFIIIIATIIIFTIFTINQIIALNGLATEGIFRIPADFDEVLVT